MRELLRGVIPPDKIDELISISQMGYIESGEYFIREGDVPRKFAFVFSGLFRYVYVDDRGHEYTKGIIPERNFISSYSAMSNQTPSYFFIEAMEDAEILKIPYQKWIRLLEKDVFWVKLLLGYIEKGFVKKERRERDLLLLDAETRYLNFLEEYPDMDKRIKQSVIASYLGIQPESLSRIRKKRFT